MKSLLLPLFLLLTVFSHGQYDSDTDSLLSSMAFESLKNIRINRADFKLDLTQFFKKPQDVPKNFKIVNQGARLFLLENGSGRIFETNSKLDSLTRIDSTKFSGYCFGASVFTYKDTLYSIGGYGFWQLNGIVRYFDKTTLEWTFKPTNIEIPFAEGLNAWSHFDEQKGQFYLIYQPPSKENITTTATNKDVSISCARLNISEGYWTIESYDVDKTWGDKISDFSEVLEGPDGIILNSKKSSLSLYVNLVKKRVFEIPNNFVTKKKQLFASIKNYITFWEADTLKIYSYDTDATFAIPMNVVGNGKNLLGQEKNQNFSFIKHRYIDFILLLLLIISTSFALVFYTKYKNKIKNSLIEKNNSATVLSYKTKDFILLLDEIEKDTLQLLVKNSLNKERTSIDEINKTLQITNRPYKIQNNIRAEVIAQINKKYSAFNEIKEELIVRKRASFDKRYLEYLINERHLKKIADLF